MGARKPGLGNLTFGSSFGSSAANTKPISDDEFDDDDLDFDSPPKTNASAPANNKPSFGALTKKTELLSDEEEEEEELPEELEFEEDVNDDDDFDF